MIQLLAIDMDGTCLNDKKEISPQTLEQLKRAAQAGIRVVPTTGRTLTCIPHQLRGEDFYRYVISSNGAVVTDTQKHQDLHEALIPGPYAAEFLRKCDEIRVGISAHIRHEFVIQGHGLRLLGRLNFGKDASYTKYARNIAAALSKIGPGVEEIQLFYFTEDCEKRTKALLSRYPDLEMAFSDHYVEIYSREASKGNALTALARHLGIPRENIACIGDAENDLSMFRASGMKFAMGNAIPELKAQADVVLPSNEEDGVAAAIRDHIL